MYCDSTWRERLIYLMVFLGPLSAVLLGKLVPVIFLIISLVVGIVALVITVQSFKNNRIKKLYFGGGLWASSGILITTFGLIRGYC